MAGRKKKVDKLHEHPAFNGTLKIISGLFDLLDDPRTRNEIGFPVNETGKYAHSSFLVPYTLQDLSSRSRAFYYWARETHGVMSDFPIMPVPWSPDGTGAGSDCRGSITGLRTKSLHTIKRRGTAICF